MKITSDSSYSEILQVVGVLESTYKEVTGESIEDPRRKVIRTEMAQIADVVLQRIQLLEVTGSQVGLRVKNETLVVEYFEDIEETTNGVRNMVQNTIAVFPEWNVVALSHNFLPHEYLQRNQEGRGSME